VSNPTTWLLFIVVLLLGIIAFWVVFTPHEQCYISTGRLYAVEYPIEKVGDMYRGVPSQFQDGDRISSDAVIECRWELGEPYRMFPFGS
jgi:hypothetical protein